MTDFGSHFEAHAIEQSIPSRFEHQVESFPDRLAVGGVRSFSYAQLNSIANALAREIMDASLSAAGAEPVGVLLSTGVEAIAALLAVLKAGHIHVALDPGHPRERLAAQVADSGARLIVTSPAHCALARSLSTARVLPFEVPSSISPYENPGLDIAPGSPATIQYTSGSTGSPKGVLHPHRSILHNVRGHANRNVDGDTNGGVGAGDRFLPNRLPGSLNALLNGASVFPYAVKENGFGSLSRWLREHEITVMSAVPTTFRRFAAQLTADDSFPRLRLIKLTGEAIYRGDVELFQQRFAPGCRLQFSFALTETGAVAWRLIDHDTMVHEDLVPVGRPLEGKEVLLLDEARCPVAAGGTAEIAVRSRYIAAGYWRQPGLTEDRFRRDPDDPDVRIYLTGDLGRIGPDGMLVHLGRKDSQVKIRANRVETAEVEAALRGIDGVGDAAVVARLDDSGETCLAAYFVPSRTPAPPFGVVRRALAQRLPDHMVPATVTPVAQLPLLPNGKVDRRALPDPLRSEPSPAAASFEAPRTPTESLVAETWRTILHVERVGRGDNFFDLGGNSLAAVESATVLEGKTGVRVSPVAMASQTLAQVAAIYRERSSSPRPGLMPALRRFIRGRES